MLTIGELSRLTHLSVRTLRRYHEDGLLVPAAVTDGGHRAYAPAQVPTAQVVARLRELDVPLADVRRLLATTDPDVRSALAADHLERLEEQLRRTRAAVVSLRRLLRPATDGLDVALVREPARTVAVVEGVVRHEDVLVWFAGAMAELEAVVDAPAGPPGGQFDDALLTGGSGRALVHLPVEVGPPACGRVRAVSLPAVELAVTVHAGPHDDIAVTYGELGRWVVEHALAVDGPVHETYLVGPRDTADAGRWRTRVGWPVFRLAGTPPPGDGAVPGGAAPLPG